MNREIKFRFWDKENNIITSGYSLEELQKTAIRSWFDVETPRQVELMQYTGLKDKNGKEIYEGDIIQMWVGTKPVTVGNITWGGWQYVVRMEVVGKDKTNYFGYNSEDIDPEKIEIIGNIYENPDLLKN